MRIETTPEAALAKVADAIARDVAGDFPETDVNYDLYVEKIDVTTWGIIDMGEAGQWAYEWYGGEWLTANRDPVALKERIVARRTRGETR